MSFISQLFTIFFALTLVASGKRRHSNRYRSRGRYRSRNRFASSSESSTNSLPGLDNYDAETARNLYLDEDFPGENGVPTQFAYKKNTIIVTVEDRSIKLGYIECGENLTDPRPILFLHGQPTYSHLWRNVLPFVCSQGHGIALDLPGYGRSDKYFPDFTFSYGIDIFEAFVEAMEFEDIVLVLHDWGAAYGLGYTNRNPTNIAGVAIFETIINDFGDFVDDGSFVSEFFTRVTAQEIGDDAYNFLINDLGFINTELNDVLLVHPNDEILTAYLHPFSTGDLDDRFIQFLLPQCIPFTNLAGEGNSLYGELREEMIDIIAIWQTWMENNDDIPKLGILATPGTLSGLLQLLASNTNIENFILANLSPGIHYLSEDDPHRVGAIILRWLHETGLAPIEW